MRFSRIFSVPPLCLLGIAIFGISSVLAGTKPSASVWQKPLPLTSMKEGAVVQLSIDPPPIAEQKKTGQPSSCVEDGMLHWRGNEIQICVGNSWRTVFYRSH